MTELQAIAHFEQVEARRRDFLRWWNTNIKPNVPRDYTSQCVSRDEHWKAYLRKHQLNTKP